MIRQFAVIQPITPPLLDLKGLKILTGCPSSSYRIDIALNPCHGVSLLGRCMKELETQDTCQLWRKDITKPPYCSLV